MCNGCHIRYDQILVVVTYWLWQNISCGKFWWVGGGEGMVPGWCRSGRSRLLLRRDALARRPRMIGAGQKRCPRRAAVQQTTIRYCYLVQSVRATLASSENRTRLCSFGPTPGINKSLSSKKYLRRHMIYKRSHVTWSKEWRIKNKEYRIKNKE